MLENISLSPALTPHSPDEDPHRYKEWLVTNGLGGYATGTVAGAITRRYHGLLIAALPNPLGRMMMLNGLSERLRLPDRSVVYTGAEELVGLAPEAVHPLSSFRLENAVPVWRYEIGECILEKRLVMPYRQNTVHVTYRLLRGTGVVRLNLRPAIQFRPHDDSVCLLQAMHYRLSVYDDQFEIEGEARYPTLRLLLHGPSTAFTVDRKETSTIPYTTERNRGYPCEGSLWSPGYFRTDLEEGQETTLVASTENWETIHALSPAAAFRAETERCEFLVSAAAPELQSGLPAQLVLAADQFLITPVGRTQDAVRAKAAGDEIRTVIAGYHWFTDWGRDTMISLEGLTLMTGRTNEAGWILRTFAEYIRNGLIPNMFPEGQKDGLYHTADATLWFFHAIHRYVETTGDRVTLRQLLPKLADIVRHHRQGTDFGIRMDPEDGLLRQGAEGYQLTWMDAKVDDWVVTPRRGKAVEINALWYNALRLLERWLLDAGDADGAAPIGRMADQARESFNKRFWYEAGGYLYDVIDGEAGEPDDACRPNQVLAISLDHAVLDESRWPSVMDVVTRKLLTPLGLRSLAPDHPDYKAKYYGDLRSRDAAYHQGTVWAWLIGPYVDAWIRLHPGRNYEARGFLAGLLAHMDDACIGSISEVFDADAPFLPRGCIAQAWSVAEVLRCWVKTAE
ncbi:glycogen debranching enzyme [Solidesulfovibrio carbinoliphilus subsp. oakridgensis]|uniref:Glycogen debranching enzyme n=1 Tax=Solidesulfovibrio carbinoliphilus subsp. oakridgensis TaxID=694327 RepID=G7Q990_9BACT|nr:amylo-alpha-1,6-glucosidase [Solidesulfovibrio carbinoliphilus]EHJ48133.1 glycogen debranching enzyme [Solidesulfovibrio carbinoliphilus subsp. oakridgensis]